MRPRFAIYYAPEAGSKLCRFGSGLLGRDAATGRGRPFPSDLPVDAALWRSWAAEPARYGFHATLKPPFELRDGFGEPSVLAAAEALARSLGRVTVPSLDVALLGSFAALRPAASCARLDHLAASVVKAFEPHRAPLSLADRTRRLAAGLTPRQADYLERYGYPYVLEEFRFHMTLTGPLPAERRELVRRWLEARWEAVRGPVVVDALTVFRQRSRDAPFTIVERLPLRG